MHLKEVISDNAVLERINTFMLSDVRRTEQIFNKALQGEQTNLMQLKRFSQSVIENVKEIENIVKGTFNKDNKVAFGGMCVSFATGYASLMLSMGFRTSSGDVHPALLTVACASAFPFLLCYSKYIEPRTSIKNCAMNIVNDFRNISDEIKQGAQKLKSAIRN